MQMRILGSLQRTPPNRCESLSHFCGAGARCPLKKWGGLIGRIAFQRMQRVMGQSTVSKARQPGKSWWVVYLDAAAGAESIDHLALLAEVRSDQRSAAQTAQIKSTVTWQARSASQASEL